MGLLVALNLGLSTVRRIAVDGPSELVLYSCLSERRAQSILTRYRIAEETSSTDYIVW